MKGKDIVPSRTTITREIIRQAADIRECLSVDLKNAARNGFVLISPDLWTDKFKQNTYLGLTAHFIDRKNKLCSLDICCEPYNEIDKRGDNIREAILNALARFEINDMVEKIFFVSDRGSNLVKAQEGFNVIHCFLHRLNNVLNGTFYSAGTREKIERKNKARITKRTQRDDQSMWHDLENNDQDPLLDYDDRDSSDSDSDEENFLSAKSVELVNIERLQQRLESSFEFVLFNVSTD